MRLYHTKYKPSRLIYEYGHGFVKESEDRPQATYGLAGRLYLSKSGWLLLHVPNAFANGAFDALAEPGIEKPSKNGKAMDAHISVMSKQEVANIGADKITERGHVFRYQLGQLKAVKPFGQGEYNKVWFVEVQSPELKQLRKSYGLTPLPHEDHPFHITVAYRRKNVLRTSEVSKVAERSFLGEAVGQRLNTPFRTTGNPMQDMAAYLTSIPQMANQRIRLARGADQMKGFYDPQYREEQTLRMLEGQPDEIVTNPYDRVIQAFPSLNV